MSKYPLIDSETVETFTRLVGEGMSQEDAADHVDRNVHSIRLWLQRRGLEMPSTKAASTVTDDVLSYADAYRTGLMTQREIAIAVGCAPPYVSRLLSKYSAERITSKKVGVFKQIVNHIKQNGGRPKETSRKLGLLFDSTAFYRYIREKGIDLRSFQFANQEYGSWLTVACDWVKVGTNYFVRALCKRCGNTYDNVSLTNLRSGKSSCCHNCSTGISNGLLKVKCLTTGTEFKSILNFCTAIDMAGAYQMLRLQLKKHGVVAINGREYELITS